MWDMNENEGKEEDENERVINDGDRDEREMQSGEERVKSCGRRG